MQSYKPRPSSKSNYFEAIKRTGETAFIRDNIFGTELIWGNERFTFPSKEGRKSMSYLFIFSMVKRDAETYLKKRPIKRVPSASPIVYNNNAAPHKPLAGTDIDQAYWNIAHRLHIISDNTYQRGLEIKEKHILLSSLSSLGRDKRYTKVEQGMLTNEVLIVKGDDDLKKIYHKIRYQCFSYMRHLAKLLGNDFVAYKTDCIYYIDKKKNINTVQEFLDGKGLDYKMVYDFDSFHDEKTY